MTIYMKFWKDNWQYIKYIPNPSAGSKEWWKIYWPIIGAGGIIVGYTLAAILYSLVTNEEIIERMPPWLGLALFIGFIFCAVSTFGFKVRWLRKKIIEYKSKRFSSRNG